jgi:hypothetical protein
MYTRLTRGGRVVRLGFFKLVVWTAGMLTATYGAVLLAHTVSSAFSSSGHYQPTPAPINRATPVYSPPSPIVATAPLPPASPYIPITPTPEPVAAPVIAPVYVAEPARYEVRQYVPTPPVQARRPEPDNRSHPNDDVRQRRPPEHQQEQSRQSQSGNGGHHR